MGRSTMRETVKCTPHLWHYLKLRAHSLLQLLTKRLVQNCMILASLMITLRQYVGYFVQFYCLSCPRHFGMYCTIQHRFWDWWWLAVRHSNFRCSWSLTKDFFFQLVILYQCLIELSRVQLASESCTKDKPFWTELGTVWVTSWKHFVLKVWGSQDSVVVINHVLLLTNKTFNNLCWLPCRSLLTMARQKWSKTRLKSLTSLWRKKKPRDL